MLCQIISLMKNDNPIIKIICNNDNQIIKIYLHIIGSAF